MCVLRLISNQPQQLLHGFTSLIDLPNALKPVSILGFYSSEGKYLVSRVRENQRFKRAGATPSFMMYVCVCMGIYIMCMHGHVSQGLWGGPAPL